MIQSFITRMLKRRHFWRYASFSEVAELYASRTIRVLALRMVSLFIALYLYQLGYSLEFIALYFALYFSFKVAVSYFAARYAARFGPKHGILVGNLLYIPALIAFTFVAEQGILALALFGLFQALSVTVYDLCYMVDFSKVKHVEHAGKELGFMQIFEKTTSALSPFIGGAVAFFWGVEATMWLSAALFLVASWPLLRTGEQVKTGQKLELRGFPWRATWRSLRAETAVGFDQFTSGTVWSLFVAVVVFAGSGSELYLEIGALTSVTFVTAFVAAYIFGRLIDRRRGGELLRYSVLGNAIVHASRGFVTTPVSVAMTNVMNETATTGFTMAFTRGVFDTADMSGRRIVYMLFIEIALNVGSALACLVLAGCLLLVGGDDIFALQLFFGATALYSLLLATPRFALYQRR